MAGSPDLPDTYPTVLLRHTLESGESHIDWMVASGEVRDTNGRILLTWRLAEPTVSRFAGRDAFCFDGIRLPNHRARYLEYEGPIGKRRGRVEGVARGWAAIHVLTDIRTKISIQLTKRWEIVGERVGPAPDPKDDGPAPLGLWRFRAEAADGPAG